MRERPAQCGAQVIMICVHVIQPGYLILYLLRAIQPSYLIVSMLRLLQEVRSVGLLDAGPLATLGKLYQRILTDPSSVRSGYNGGLIDTC
jgi:hypothetical protein